MTAPTAPTLPSSGTLQMQRNWVVEVDTGTDDSADWNMIEAVTNVDFQPSAGVWTDSTDQSGKGKTSEVKTGDTFTLQVTVDESSDPDDATAHAPVQKFLHDAGEATGAANVVSLRISEYDFNDPDGTASPRVYAYTASAGVDYAPQSADVNAKQTTQITFHPDASGPLKSVTHPYPASGD